MSDVVLGRRGAPGASEPVYLGGRTDGGVYVPYAGFKRVPKSGTNPTDPTGPTNPPPAAGRDWYLAPGDKMDPLRIPLSASAVYGVPGEPITDAIRLSTGGVVNHRNGWSRQAVDGRVPGAILSRFTNPNTSATIDFWLPPDFVPPLGSNGLVADGACAFAQPDGSGWDVYKPVMQSRGTRTATNPGGTLGQWTSTRWVQQNLKGSLIVRGVSAAGISYFAGLIREWELEAIRRGELDDIPHGLACSIFPRDNTMSLKPAPITATDGGGADTLAYDTINGVQVAVALFPANTRDAQNGGNIYNGTVPMGTTMAVPRTTVLESLPFWGDLDIWGRATVRTLQRRGAVVTDASGSIALYAEPSCAADAVGTTTSGVMEAWRLIRPYLRQVKGITPTQPAGGPAPYLAPLAADFAA